MHTIRFKITRITAVIVVLVLAFWSFFMLLFFKSDSAQKEISAAEHLMQLTGRDIGENINQLRTLAEQCTGIPEIISYLREDDASKYDSLAAFREMSRRSTDNTAQQYINRFVITDFTDKYLQLGRQDYLRRSNPSKESNIRTLEKTLPENPQAAVCGFDHYGTESFPGMIITVPILIAPERPQGVSYIAANLQLLTDSIKNYFPDKHGSVFLMNGRDKNVYDAYTFDAVQDISFTPEKMRFEKLGENTSFMIAKQNGKDKLALRFPISSVQHLDLYVVVDVTGLALFPIAQTVLVVMMICVLLGAFLFLHAYVQRLINHPIGILQKRLKIISDGDFSKDPEIEWPNEFGEIGKNINMLTGNISYLMECRVNEEKERQNLEYRMLQQQISPHFIYNALNSIKWMATIQNAPGIAEISTSLARLLRWSTRSRSKLISLQEELAVLNDYCVILHYRYGNDLNVDIEEISDEQLCRCKIPAFTLQPLVENAVFHGIAPKGGGSVMLTIRRTQTDDLEILVRDDGLGMEPQQLREVQKQLASAQDSEFKDQHLGICNVHRRIRYAFGEKYGLSVTSTENSGTCVQILLPCTKENREETI